MHQHRSSSVDYEQMASSNEAVLLGIERDSDAQLQRTSKQDSKALVVRPFVDAPADRLGGASTASPAPTYYRTEPCCVRIPPPLYRAED